MRVSHVRARLRAALQVQSRILPKGHESLIKRMVWIQRDASHKHMHKAYNGYVGLRFAYSVESDHGDLDVVVYVPCALFLSRLETERHPKRASFEGQLKPERNDVNYTEKGP